MSRIEKELGNDSTRLLFITVDVTREEDVKRAIDQTVEKFGTIHVALPFAGRTALTPTLTSRGSVNMKVFEKVMQINTMGSVYVAKYAAVQMSKNEAVSGEKGVIVFVTSI